jgi:hypothetical protein
MNWKFWKKEEKKCDGRVDYASVLKAMGQLPHSTVLPPSKPALREPVLSMLEAMKDLGRWECVLSEFGNHPTWCLDSTTNVVYQMHYDVKTIGYRYFLADFKWLTDEERAAVVAGLRGLVKACHEKKMEEQRQKMMELYCVSKENM